MSATRGDYRIPKKNPANRIDGPMEEAVLSQKDAAATVSRGKVRVTDYAEPSKPTDTKAGKRPRRGLTVKQQALIRALSKTKHLGKAAIEAGYSPKNATQSGAQALAAIQKTAPELLAKHGLDDDSLIEEHLIPLLQATETKFFTLPVGRGKNRKLHISTRSTANWSARVSGLDMALKVRGLYVREQENKGPEFSVIVIDKAHRPDWAAMRRTHPKIDVPGLNAPPKEE